MLGQMGVVEDEYLVVPALRMTLHLAQAHVDPRVLERLFEVVFGPTPPPAEPVDDEDRDAGGALSRGCHSPTGSRGRVRGARSGREPPARSDGGARASRCRQGWEGLPSTRVRAGVRAVWSARHRAT